MVAVRRSGSSIGHVNEVALRRAQAPTQET